MPTDLMTLLRRDHHDLECGLDDLLHAGTVAQIHSTLDGVRLGLTAHAEAEDIVLAHAVSESGDPRLGELVDTACAAHRLQESSLAALVAAPAGTVTWRDRARRLHDLVHEHARYEERTVLPAIRELLPAIYDALAGAFATERLRQLAMLQPSAPIYLPELARAS